jgi:hypothetical protein
MRQRLIIEAQVLCKRIGSAFRETLDLSNQIMDALDRNDQITVQLLLQMRAEAIASAKAADQALRKYMTSITDEDERQALAELLNHGVADGEEEQKLARLAAHNASQLRQLLQLDQRLSRRLAHGKSIYQNEKIIDPAMSGR